MTGSVTLRGYWAKIDYLSFASMCDQSNEILVDFMSRATTPGESFYELAREFQQKALHPDNNMMLKVLERNLPNH